VRYFIDRISTQTNSQQVEKNLRPDIACWMVYTSFKSIAAARAVVVGTINVKTVASESDKYCNEKYNPNNPIVLDIKKKYGE